MRAEWRITGCVSTIGASPLNVEVYLASPALPEGGLFRFYQVVLLAGRCACPSMRPVLAPARRILQLPGSE